MSSGLPSCKNPHQKKFFQQFWKNCNTADNPIGGNLIGKARTEKIRQDCCEQINCRDPWNLPGVQCPKPPPDPMPGPHFGDVRYDDREADNNPGIGVL